VPDKGLIVIGSAAVVGAVGVLVFGALQARRRRRAAVEYFESLASASDEAFVRQLGLAPGSDVALKAVAVRKVVAQFGRVPAQSLGAQTRFYPTMGRLPFYDSLDAVELVLAIEEATGLEIPDDVTLRIGRGEADGIETVGELATAVVALGG
jgi:acyl carrier protein